MITGCASSGKKLASDGVGKLGCSKPRNSNGIKYRCASRMSYRRVNRVKGILAGREKSSEPDSAATNCWYTEKPPIKHHRNTCGEVVIARAGGGFAFSISRIADLVNGLLRDT